MAKPASILSRAKVQARALQRAAKSHLNQSLTLSQCQELVAGQLGFDNWDTLAGVLSAKPVAVVPTLADLEFVPCNVTYESGSTSKSYSVECFESDLAHLVHDPVALQAYLTANAALYPKGLDELVIDGLGDGADLALTARQLMGLKFCKLGGKEYWELPDETYLRFDEKVVVPEQKGPAVFLPEVLKSAKGCQLLVLPSKEKVGQLLVIVPPDRNLVDIQAKFDAELTRLKQRAAALPDDSDNEYTDADIRKFAASLGCEAGATHMRTSQTWD